MQLLENAARSGVCRWRASPRISTRGEPATTRASVAPALPTRERDAAAHQRIGPSGMAPRPAKLPPHGQTTRSSATSSSTTRRSREWCEEEKGPAARAPPAGGSQRQRTNVAAMSSTAPLSTSRAALPAGPVPPAPPPVRPRCRSSGRYRDGSPSRSAAGRGSPVKVAVAERQLAADLAGAVALDGLSIAGSTE